MDYATMLKTEAEKTIAPLGEKVRQLEKQVASVEDRILFEIGDMERRKGDLASFKDAAAAKLATSTSQYREWLARYKKLTVDLATSRDALSLLETVIAPKARLLRQEAREKLLQALTALYLSERPRCQSRMAELLDAVVAEHDAYFHACQRLHQDYGLGFMTPAFDTGVVVEHARLRHGKKLLNTSAMFYLALTDPPAPAEAPPVDLRPPEAAPVAQGDRQAAPGEAISDPLDTGAVPEQAPNAVPSVQGPDKAAQDAPGATNGERPDTQDAPDAPDPEKKGSRLPLGATPEPAGMDPDADPLDLDADAGEKNLGIAEDCS